VTSAQSGSAARAPSSWRRADIQGLRAVAVLLVVAFHAGLPVPGGFIGVDVFFVISGFVITELILRSLDTPGGFRFRTFYARRLKRLLPALALMVAVVLALSIVLLSPLGAQQTAAATGLGAVFFVANFVIYSLTGDYFDAPAETNPLLHTWSLSVEEQFYFIFPALMVLAWWLAHRRRSGGRRMSFILLSGLAVLSFLLCVAMSFGWSGLRAIERPAEWAFYSSLTRAWEFAVGALLAMALTSARMRTTRLPGQALSVMGALLLIISAFAITGSSTFPGFIVAVPVLGTLLVIAGGSAGGVITAACRRR
jgi:peptidoglycan/LPS O-acetylase OafA/YrhL